LRLIIIGPRQQKRSIAAQPIKLKNRLFANAIINTNLVQIPHYATGKVIASRTDLITVEQILRKPDGIEPGYPFLWSARSRVAAGQRNCSWKRFTQAPRPACLRAVLEV